MSRPRWDRTSLRATHTFLIPILQINHLIRPIPIPPLRPWRSVIPRVIPLPRSLRWWRRHRLRVYVCGVRMRRGRKTMRMLMRNRRRRPNTARPLSLPIPRRTRRRSRCRRRRRALNRKDLLGLCSRDRERDSVRAHRRRGTHTAHRRRVDRIPPRTRPRTPSPPHLLRIMRLIRWRRGSSRRRQPLVFLPSPPPIFSRRGWETSIPISFPRSRSRRRADSVGVHIPRRARN